MTWLIKIGARGSKLSVAQTEQTRAALQKLIRSEPGATLQVVSIATSGDRLQEGRLAESGGKGLFTKELDEALLEGHIDLAVHSLKDLPTRLPEGIELICVPEREDPRDAFISKRAKDLGTLPAGANIGTASLRRQAQTLFVRPDLGVVTLRGNVDTRLKKLDDGHADATYLAFAGLKRLGLANRATSLIDPREMPPAACQGALAITARTGYQFARDALEALESRRARIEIEAERAFLEALDGSCRTAIGALARAQGGELRFIGEALTPDGTARWRRTESIALGHDPAAEARELGHRLGGEIRDEAGDALVTDSA